MLAFVIMRDRVTYAQRCVAALEAAGLDVIIVDHDSQYPQALIWLRAVDADYDDAAKPLVEYGLNAHPRDLWAPRGPIHDYAGGGERFIVTDCDVVPADDCPADWVQYLGLLLDERPTAVKAGLGLRTADLPPWYERRDAVREWESRYQPPQAQPVGSWSAVWADVDTTLAMYRRYEPFTLGPAIRTTAPYEALHLPWYEDTANLPEEIRFYNSHAEYGHWRAPDGYTDTHGLEATP